MYFDYFGVSHEIKKGILLFFTERLCIYIYSANFHVLLVDEPLPMRTSKFPYDKMFIFGDK